MDKRDFGTILVANRGEIALRIMRTARAMGYRTIAVYSDADRGAPHCRAADLALSIGPSYLNICALLAAARTGDAGAVHPGYGFLAEHPGFAQACSDAGLVFIGPSVGAIGAMGNKREAKRMMREAGVACIPGYHGADQSGRRLAAEAAAIGYPVMIKPAAGGGGRGIRRAADARGFAAALDAARSEAAQAFGSAEVILERALIDPRHIEVQVFGDMHGNLVHLGERDCSVQRRHQKLIEESPSPAVSPELRMHLVADALAAARHIDYCGAGTVEYLLDREGAFYFMEMNTRLQVEHAVTEAVAGVDLVEWQLRVARGETLPLSQAAIDARLAAGGHAIEVRLCAEDPERGFLAQGGAVARWRAPAGVRCDHALEDGAAVPPMYDSMLAKLVAQGAGRAEALRRLALALDDCVLLGVTTNRRFLRGCLAHPEFAAGAANTGFVDAFMAPEARYPDDAAIDAACALLSQAPVSMWPAELHGWSNSAGYPRMLRFLLDGVPFQRRADMDQPLPAEFASDAAGCHFLLSGREHLAVDITYRQAARAAEGAAGGRIDAPMNGRIAALAVGLGDQVRTGQLLMVLEAMKMEHSIVAPCDGVVQRILAAPGEQVAPGRALMEIGTFTREA